METLRYVLGVMLVVFYPPAVVYWLLIHPLAGWWRRRGPVVALAAVGLLCVGLSVLLFLVHDVLMGRDLGTSWWAVGAGVLFYGASVAMEMRTRKQLDFRTLAGVPEVSESAWRRGPGARRPDGSRPPSGPDAEGPGGGSEASAARDPRLLTEGMYARVRHPRYLGVILGSVGFSLVVNYVGVYVMVGAFIPVLFLVVVLEERELVGRFGQAYRDYQGRVPRWIPRLGRGPGPSGGIGGDRSAGGRVDHG